MIRLPNIKLRHLQAFLEVASQKSVGKAAEVLAVSQPAVTRTIRELETALGVRLFEREGRGIRITGSGEAFLRHAGTSVVALRQGLESVVQTGGQVRNPLRIGALPTVSARVMPTAVALFLEEEPQALPRIVTGENAILLDQLRLGELDLVVGRLAAPERMTGLSFEPLYAEEVVFACRALHPLARVAPFSPEELRNYTILMPTPGSIIRPFVDRLLINHGVPELRNMIETVSDAFGRAFVMRYDAVWIISKGAVADDLADGRMIALPVDASETRGSVGLTRRVDGPQDPLADRFARIIRATVTSRSG